MVTAAVDAMQFRAPVKVGDVITLRATVNATWRTSMEVGVRVEAENPDTGEVRHTNTAYLTMVAVDEHGQPSPVPPIIASTPDEQRRERETGLRRENRLAERAQILAHRERSEDG